MYSLCKTTSAVSSYLISFLQMRLFPTPVLGHVRACFLLEADKNEHPPYDVKLKAGSKPCLAVWGNLVFFCRCTNDEISWWYGILLKSSVAPEKHQSSYPSYCKTALCSIYQHVISCAWPMAGLIMAFGSSNTFLHYQLETATVEMGLTWNTNSDLK